MGTKRFVRRNVEGVREMIVSKKELEQILVHLFENGYGEMTVKDLLELLRQGVSLT
jgi:hypothetical protein